MESQTAFADVRVVQFGTQTCIKKKNCEWRMKKKNTPQVFKIHTKQ